MKDELHFLFFLLLDLKWQQVFCVGVNLVCLNEIEVLDWF